MIKPSSTQAINDKSWNLKPDPMIYENMSHVLV